MAADAIGWDMGCRSAHFSSAFFLPWRHFPYMIRALFWNARLGGADWKLSGWDSGAVKRGRL